MTRHIRQTDIINPANYRDRRVVVVGCGNIGSHTTLALARMGVAKFLLVDFDTVEEHNLASQAYTTKDMGRLKVEALKEQVAAIDDTITVDTVSEAYQRAGVTITTDDIVVSAVDSLDTRREVRELLPEHAIVVDGRMGGGQIEVHCSTAKDWHIPAEGDTDPCSARYVSYTSYIIAGLMTNSVKRILCGESNPAATYLAVNTLELLKK